MKVRGRFFTKTTKLTSNRISSSLTLPFISSHYNYVNTKFSSIECTKTFFQFSSRKYCSLTHPLPTNHPSPLPSDTPIDNNNNNEEEIHENNNNNANDEKQTTEEEKRSEITHIGVLTYEMLASIKVNVNPIENYHTNIENNENIKFLKTNCLSRRERRKLQKMEQETTNTLSNNNNNKRIFIDATFGFGTHSTAILQNDPTAIVIGLDCDIAVLPYASRLDALYPDRFEFRLGRMQNMSSQFDYLENKVSGIIMDLGVSTMQLLSPERGFSFRLEGPLDMRMDRIRQKLTAEEVVNTYTEYQLHQIISQYGEEENAKTIAKVISRERKVERITTTKRLADIIVSSFPMRMQMKKGTKHLATKTFQALRIFINSELDEIKCALNAAEGLLKEGGRLSVISFHSLEDRIVKQFLRFTTGQTIEKPIGGENPVFTQAISSFSHFDYDPSFLSISRKPIVPTEEEISFNPRSRSAKLRVAERTAAAPLQETFHTIYGDPEGDEE